MLRGLGREVARRTLVWTDGRKGKVIVRIGIPVETGEYEWACPCVISGIGLHGWRRMFGVDSLQALLMAVEVVRVRLAPHRDKLTWFEGGEPGDTGITKFAPYGCGVALTKRIERLIEQETLRYGNAVRRRVERKLARRAGLQNQARARR